MAPRRHNSSTTKMAKNYRKSSKKAQKCPTREIVCEINRIDPKRREKKTHTHTVQVSRTCPNWHQTSQTSQNLHQKHKRARNNNKKNPNGPKLTQNCRKCTETRPNNARKRPKLVKTGRRCLFTARKSQKCQRKIVQMPQNYPEQYHPRHYRHPNTPNECQLTERL